MGSGHGKELSQQQELNAEELATKYPLSVKQIRDLVEAFKSTGKAKVDQKEFVRVVLKVKESHPELARFDDDVIALVFSFCDVDHDEKLDPFEVIAALATFSADTTDEDKARLVFKTIDKDNNQILNKAELRKHSHKVLKLAAEITKNRVKRDFKAAVDSNAGAAIAGFTLSMGTHAIENMFVESIIEQVFQSRTSDAITLDEWTRAASTNTTVRALLSPTICSKAWGAVFGFEKGFEDVDATAALLKEHPKGLCVIFEKLFELGAEKLPEVKIEVSLTLVVDNPADSSMGDESPDSRVTKVFNQIEETLEDVANYAHSNLKTLQTNSVKREDILLYKDNQSFGIWEIEEPLHKRKFQDGDVLRIANNSNWKGKVVIRTLTGRDRHIEDVSNLTTIGTIKELYSDSEGVPIEQQRLIYQGRQMENDKSLSDYKVAPNTLIHIVLQLGRH